MHIHEQYMRRALQLASYGYGFTYTNPMVGAVIVAADGRIIGEGWHRRFGGPHAEVNAVRSVSESDKPLLPESTIYVTLEPCSHYGKTPPCAKLLIDMGIPRVVIGADDPFPEVAGRGIRMLREAGREVITGVLKQECYDINLPFMRAHELKRPFVTIKWAQSSDGFIAHIIDPSISQENPIFFSSPVSSIAVHRLRAACQGIMVGVDTVIADNPRLDCRLWPAGDTPTPVTFRSPRLPADARMLQRKHILREQGEPLADFLSRLYAEYKFNHLLVEGGSRTISEFIQTDLFDDLRIEISPVKIGKGIPAPGYDPSGLLLISESECPGINPAQSNLILHYRRYLC